MNERIKVLAEQTTVWKDANHGYVFDKEKFAELIVQECIDKIETYRIPVGNSSAGEMASEMTYSALMEIRDEIKEHFGVGLQPYKVICDRTNNP